MARSAGKEKRVLTKEIRRVTGLAQVICSQIAMAFVQGRALELPAQWNSASSTDVAVAKAVRLIGGQIQAVGPRGVYAL